MKIDYYKKEFFQEAKEQRNKTLLVYLMALGVFLLITVALFLWYGTLPYEDERIKLVKFIQYVVLGVFVLFSGVYLGIKFKRVQKYYKKCIDVETGLTETSSGVFIETNESIQSKDGVDFKCLVFLELNPKKNNFFERKVLVFYEKPFPEIEEGVKVKYTTQGNVLKYYEIVEEPTEGE